MYLEGARWDFENRCLERQLPKQLVVQMPLIQIIPVEANRLKLRNSLPTPVYITQLRRNAMGVGLVFEANLHTELHPSLWNNTDEDWQAFFAKSAALNAKAFPQAPPVQCTPGARELSLSLPLSAQLSSTRCRPAGDVPDGRAVPGVRQGRLRLPGRLRPAALRQPVRGDVPAGRGLHDRGVRRGLDPRRLDVQPRVPQRRMPGLHAAGRGARGAVGARA